MLYLKYNIYAKSVIDKRSRWINSKGGDKDEKAFTQQSPCKGGGILAGA